MTDRTVRVSLVAQVSGYLEGMEKARKKTSETASEVEKLEAKKKAFEEIGRYAMAGGALAAAGLAIAIKKAADFDAQMSQVQSLSHATARDMGVLRNAALEMGQGIGLSATEAADAQIELVKAGVGVKDMINGGLSGALNLAAAGQIDVAQSTQIAATALTQFNLKGKDIPHLADLLAAGADKALGGVDQLGQALNQGGLVAAQFGLSVDDTVGTLAAFANAGLLGSDAGTSFKTMLLSLASPSSKASSLMKELKINAYDASGQFVGITNLAGQLHDKLGSLSQAQRDNALSTIFGTDAIRTANVLYKEGAKGIQGWIDSVNDTGFAAEQARGKMNNLNGDTQKLGAALDTALIRSGSAANDTLRSLAQGATGLVKGIGDLPQPVLSAGMAVTGLAAGVGILGGGFLVLVPRIAAARAAMKELQLTGSSVGKVFGRGGAVLIGVEALAGAISSAGSSAVLTADQISKVEASGRKSGKALDKVFTDVNGSAMKFKDTVHLFGADDFFGNYNSFAGPLNGAIKSITFGMADLGKWADVDKAKLQELGKGLSDLAEQDLGKAQQQFQRLVSAAGGTEQATKELLSVMPDYKAKLTDLAAAQGINVTESDLLTLAVGRGNVAQQLAAVASQDGAKAYIDAANAAGDLTQEVSDLIDKINEANGVGQDAITANAAYQDALQKVKDTIDKAKAGTDGYSLSLDAATAAGADNLAMFADLADKSQAAAKAQFDVDHNSQQYIANLTAGRGALIQQLTDMGLTADAAGAVADQVYRIPTQREVDLIAQTAQAKKDVDDFKAWLDKIPNERIVNIITRSNAKQNASDGPGFASGGTVVGPGGPKTDSIWARLSAGEEVIQNPYARIYRSILKRINSGTYPRDGVQAFAGGGTVQPVRGSNSDVVTTPILAPVTYNNQFTAPAIETQDPLVYATIIGREFGRRVAG